MENVNYVDAKIGANEYHVRCSNPEQAKILAAAKILGQSEILSGDPEVNYWQKIKDDREAKLSGKIKMKKSSNNKPYDDGRPNEADRGRRSLSLLAVGGTGLFIAIFALFFFNQSYPNKGHFITGHTNK